MFVVREMQRGKGIMVSIFHFLHFLIKTCIYLLPFLLLFLVMSKNKDGLPSFIVRMPSACLSQL